ncbi:MAG: hypothetical protein QOI54_86 [Actinomycetota bacterium]|jgi:pimeloyl-ACP methyl ester carboxylesterase|nr:hypothetical protein [Actinomycetota bacterium]
MSRAWWAALVALALLAPACTSSAGSPAPQASRSGRATGPSPTAGTPGGVAVFYQQRLRWRGCGDGFDCTRVRVPVDYSRPAGPTLRLAVIRLKARGADRLGSLLINPGGPGASGVDYARAADVVVSKAVRERYDVVGFDPRGVARSRPIRCLTGPQTDAYVAQDGSPDTAAEEAALLRISRQLAAGCAARNGAFLAHVGTRDAARDLDVLRAVLGDRKLRYLGKSYGTYLGAVYAELFPRRVGRVVLDGVVDPAADQAELSRSQAVGFQRALGSFVDDCLRRSGCPLAGDRTAALARLQRFLTDVDRHPLRASRPVTQSLALLGMAEAMYDTSAWSFLRLALRDAFRGDGEPLLVLADAYAERGENGRYLSNLMVALPAVNCLDQPETSDLATFRARAAELARVSPIFGAYVAWGSLPCGYWPVPAQGRPAPIRATGAPPILVVGTTRDPATPYAAAQAVARELDRARLLTYVGDGHTAYRHGSRCIDEQVDAFLLDDRLPPVGTRCR